MRDADPPSPSRRPDRRGGAAAWAGVIGPVVFVGAVVAAGLRRPGYDQWSRFLSELGEQGAAGAGLVNAAFIATGACLIVFGLAVRRGLPGGASAGPLVALAGPCFWVMAASPCSTGCPIAVVDAAATPGDAIHNLAAIVALAAMAVAPLVVADALGRPGDGAPLPWWYRSACLAAGYGVAGASAAFGLAVVAHQPRAIGVSERALVGIAVSWVALTAAVLLRRPRHR